MFSYIIPLFTKPRILLAFSTPRAHFQLMYSLLSIRMPRLFTQICPQAFSAQPVSLPGALPSQVHVSAFVLVKLQSPSRTFLQLV